MKPQHEQGETGQTPPLGNGCALFLSVGAGVGVYLVAQGGGLVFGIAATAFLAMLAATTSQQVLDELRSRKP